MNAKMKNGLRNGLHNVLGCAVTAAGILLLKHSHVVTGGLTGLSLSLSYLLHTKIYTMFLLMNVPFIVFSYFKLGRSFTIRSIISVILVSIFTTFDSLLSDYAIPSLVGAIVGGIVIGVGVATLFKNGSSLGGSTILAIYLQRRYQRDPGKTNFVFDFLTVLSSFSAVTLSEGFVSILSIAFTSVVISLFKNNNKGAQRPDRQNLPTATAT